MAKQEHLELIKQGGKFWNRWRATASVKKPDLSGANLMKADLRNVDLSWVNLMEANLREARLSWANLRRANLRKADLRRAIIKEANFSWANLSWTNFRESYLRGSNFRRADLSWANLKACNLKATDLREALLSHADLREVNLREADLKAANLQEAYLSHADLREADLSDANLQEADLREAHLFQTNLEGTNLSGCHVYGVAAWDVQLNDYSNQSSLIVTDWDEPIVTVDDLKIAQLLYLVLHSENIRHVLTTLNFKAILILGHFPPERKPILTALQQGVRNRGYLPILFDFQKANCPRISEMVAILARSARFVLADVTIPQLVVQEVTHIVRSMDVPVLPLLKKKAHSVEPPMFQNLRHHYRSLSETHHYQEAQDMREALEHHLIEATEIRRNFLGVP